VKSGANEKGCLERTACIRVIPLLLMLGSLTFSGCESTDEGGGGSVSAGMYYGVGFYDPWYYGGDVDIIVDPPDRPIDRPHVEHPIARPSSPSVSPRPSIPSMPRVSGRR